MYDKELVVEKLTQISDALDRVARRFEGIKSAEDFLASEQGLDMLDGICMMLIAVGENFKSIDRMTERKILTQYPDVNWRGVKGVHWPSSLKLIFYLLQKGNGFKQSVQLKSPVET